MTRVITVEIPSTTLETVQWMYELPNRQSLIIQTKPQATDGFIAQGEGTVVTYAHRIRRNRDGSISRRRIAEETCLWQILEQETGSSLKVIVFDA